MLSPGSLSTSRTTWRALATSLRALRHPLTLGSIALLLINDHVLKVVAPSPLTGKLSDLAGLFFFPFLLAALLSLSLDRLRVPPRHTAALAFGITGAWFALIKTVPAANALMVNALAHLLGTLVQIVLDPTDLLALATLVPAWGLWLRLERAPAPRCLRPADLAALGLAALATVATTQPLPLAHVVRLAVFEQNVYAGLAYRYWGEEKSTPLEVDHIARSLNGGRTWIVRQPADVPAEVIQQLEQPIRSPIVVCDPGNLQICYRITGTEQVEGSLDGGQTWQIAWQVPPGRRKLMERFHDDAYKKLDLGPHDLALLSQNGTATLIVALGNEGVLVRTPEGDWKRYGVETARPTPYAIGWFGIVWLLAVENIMLMGVAILTWWACSALGWQIILAKIRFPSEGSAWKTVDPLAFMAFYLFLVFVPLYILLAFACSNDFTHPIPLLSLLAALLFCSIGPAVVWYRVVHLSPRSQVARRAALASFLTILGIFPLAWLPFPLWALGIIPVYEMALVLSVLIGIAVLVCGITAVWRLSHLAVTPEDTTPNLE